MAKIEFVISFDTYTREASIRQVGVDEPLKLNRADLHFEAKAREILDPSADGVGLSWCRKELTGEYRFCLEGRKTPATQVAEAA